jgi:hypothetical protein
MKKKTKILIRAYCSTFEKTLSKREHFTLDQATEYVKKHIIDTAEVISVTHIFKGSETIIKNEFYKDPTQFDFKAKRVA